MRNKEPVDVLRNKTQLRAREQRQGGDGREAGAERAEEPRAEESEGLCRPVSDGEGLQRCHSVRNGKPELLGEKAEILSFMRIFVKEHSTLHFKNISKPRSSMSIEEHSS